MNIWNIYNFLPFPRTKKKKEKKKKKEIETTLYNECRCSSKFSKIALLFKNQLRIYCIQDTYKNNFKITTKHFC